jgi:hypothetical protein
MPELSSCDVSFSHNRSRLCSEVHTPLPPHHHPTPTTDSPPPEEQFPQPSSLRQFYLYVFVSLSKAHTAQGSFSYMCAFSEFPTKQSCLYVCAGPYLNVLITKQSYLCIRVPIFIDFVTEQPYLHVSVYSYTYSDPALT